MNRQLPLLASTLVLFGVTAAVAQTPTAREEVINLSKTKWQWMAEKDVAKLEPLFDDKAKFVDMGGTWKKAEEVDIIRSGRIWYKQTDVHDVAAEVFGDTAIVWSRITLHAMLGQNEVVTEFTTTEVYQKQAPDWKLLDLTFSSVRDGHQIQATRPRGSPSLTSTSTGLPVPRGCFRNSLLAEDLSVG